MRAAGASSGPVVEWRTFHGLVVHRAAVWNDADAVAHAVENRMVWPTMAPWLVRRDGSEWQIAEPFREWLPLGDEPLEEPGTPQTEAA